MEGKPYTTLAKMFYSLTFTDLSDNEMIIILEHAKNSMSLPNNDDFFEKWHECADD